MLASLRQFSKVPSNHTAILSPATVTIGSRLVAINSHIPVRAKASVFGIGFIFSLHENTLIYSTLSDYKLLKQAYNTQLQFIFKISIIGF